MKLSHALALGFALVLSSCNIFDPFDGPGDDPEQLASAARACFDAEEYECAREYYAKITNPSDQVRAEIAFLRLAPIGASIGTFMKTLGGNASDAGSLITAVANNIALKNPGQNSRLEVFRAFKESDQITTAEQKGLVRFISSISMLAEILAEEMDTKGDLRKSDIVRNVAGCPTSNCFVDNDCAAPLSGAVIDNTLGNNGDRMEGATEANFTATQPSMQMLRRAFSEVQPAITLLGSSDDNSATFAVAVLALFTDNRCVRQYLILNGVGRD